MSAIVIVGHGSREARANQAFEAFVRAHAERLGMRRPEVVVSHGYVELARPGLDEALAAAASAGHAEVLVVPLFLFMVAHTKNDVPIALARARAAFPKTRFVAAEPLGVHPLLVQVAWQRALAVVGGGAAVPGRRPLTLTLSPLARGEGTGQVEGGVIGLGEGDGVMGSGAGDCVVVVVGRGSSDPDANAEFCRVVRLFGEGRGLRAVLPAFMGVTTPLVAETLDLVARLRPRRLVVVPYLLFDGRLCERLRDEVATFAAQYPWIKTGVAAPLAPDQRLHDLLDERIAGAGHTPLPCDTCQYRAPVAGVVGAVGGMRALLYSLRHGFTHNQAAPHPHAHGALRKHVLVCGNADCADRGSPLLIDRLRQLVREGEHARDLRITRTSCLGRCGEGPTVAVYPDGIWYRGVSPDDAETLYREHLCGDRLVPHLVDNIMQ